MEWNESKQLLLDDLKGIKSETDKACFFWGDKSFTVNELIKEIENETKIGKQHIQLHIDTHKKLEEWKKEGKSSKKKWQFWK